MRALIISAIILGVAAIMVFSSIAPALNADEQAENSYLSFCNNCADPPAGQVFVAIVLHEGICDGEPFLMPVAELASAQILGVCEFI